MGGEWETVPLGELVVSHDSRRIPVKEADRKPGPYPYYGASGVVDFVDGFLFDGEYLLIAEDGENLRTRQTPVAFLATGKFWVNNHAHIVEGTERASTRYIHYALQVAEIAPFLTGAVMPKLTQGNLHQIPLPLPPRRTQDGIVALLGALDDKIELSSRMAETLEAMARALFKSWFIDFDPIRAKAEGRATGLPDDIASLFPDAFSNDALPANWEMATIGALFEISGGNTPSTKIEENWGGAHQWATPKDLSALSSPVLLRTERTLTDAGLAQSTSGLLPRGSLLLSSRAPIGYMAFATQPTAINQGFAGFKKRSVTIAYAWLWCMHNMTTIQANAGGSTFPEISKAVLRELPMLRPDARVLKAFSEVVDPFVDRIVALAHEAKGLADIRDTLLPKLISGELCIRDAESDIEAA